MLSLLEDDKYQEKGTLVPSHQRFRMRRKKLLNMDMIDFKKNEGNKSKKRSKSKKDMTQQMHQFIDTIQSQQITQSTNNNFKKDDESLSAFMMACKHLQEENVQMLLMLNPMCVFETDKDGHTALQRLEARTDEASQSPVATRIKYMLYQHHEQQRGNKN